MADPIYLVQGDTGPDIKVTFTRQDTAEVENLAGASANLHFRKKFTDTVLFSISGDATDEERAAGEMVFSFTSDELDIAPGEYEAEIEVVFSSGTRETIYERIDFLLRKDFA